MVCKGEKLITKVVLDRFDIQEGVRRIAANVDNYYNRGDFTMLVVLKGGFMFASDLARSLSSRFDIEFVTANSYDGESQKSLTVKGLDLDLRGKNVLVVDDVADNGTTLMSIKDEAVALGAVDVATCAFIYKVRDNNHIPVFCAYSLPADDWLLGYGMDLDGFGRCWPEIHRIIKDE